MKLKVLNITILILCILLSSSLNNVLAKNNILAKSRYDIDFTTSMYFDEIVSEKKLQNAISSNVFQICKDIYEKNNLSKRCPEKTLRIPKIVHLIWIGPKKVPNIFLKCLNSIRKHLPDWECKIWTDDEVDNLSLRNRFYYDEEKNYGAKSDILRYEILNMFGGVYIDIDMVLHQPLDMLNYTYDFYVGCHSASPDSLIGNAIIATTKGHPIIKSCVESISEVRDKKAVVSRTGPIYLQNVILQQIQKIDSTKIIVFPRSFFYPCGFTKRNIETKKQKEYIKIESFTMHHWSGS